MTPPPTSSPLPRWPVLIGLVALVLGVHVALLADGMAWPAQVAERAAASTSSATAVATAHGHRSTTPAATPSVQVSTVRWILPEQPQRPTAALTPKPAPRPAPVPRVEPAPMALDAAAPLVAPTEPREDPAPQTPPEPRDAASPVDPDPPEAPESVAEESAPTPDMASHESTATTEENWVAASNTASPRKAPAAILPPAQPPPSMRLQYDVTGNIKGIGYRAEGVLDWTVADGRYDARLEMRVMLLGSRSQTSIGRTGPQGLMPERFADKSRSEKAAHFDTAQQRIRFSNNAADVPLQPGAQDRLSLFMQLAGLMQARPQAYATGQTVNMQVAGTGDAPVWRFEVGEESTISVPAGEFRVRHLVRQPRKEFDSTVEMWLAPSLGHMPVRLRITQPNGDVADQKLRQMP